MSDDASEPVFAKIYSLKLRTGAVVDIATDATEITNSMIIFYQVDVNGENAEPMRGINLDEVISFEVRDYDPDDVEHEDPAPTLMDSAWGYTPGQHISDGNPYVDKPTEDDNVPDPFRGNLKFRNE